MHQPDTIGRERCAEGDVMGMLVRGVGFVGVDVAVSRFVVVAVGVGVEVTAPPAKEQPCGEEDYDHTDQSLRSLLHRPRQVTSQQHERKTDENQGCTVPKPPGNAHRATVIWRLVYACTANLDHKGCNSRLVRISAFACASHG